MIHKNFERADNILWQHKFSKKQNTKNIKNNSLSVFSALCSSFFFGTFANFPSWRVQYKHMHTHSPPNVFQLFAKPKHLTVFLSHFLFPKMIYVLKRKLFSHILFATRYRNVHKRKTGQSKKRERDIAKEIGRIYTNRIFVWWICQIYRETYSGCGFSLLFF